MRFFAGIAVPDDLKNTIDTLRASYPGRLVRHIEPHVTLVPPMEVPQPEWWLEAMQEVCNTEAPFALQLGAPDAFGKRVLFLRLEDGANALRLRDALYSATQRLTQLHGWPFQVEQRPFHPHLTLAMESFGTPLAQMDEIRQSATDLAANMSAFTVRAVRVYRRQTGGWKPFADLPLAHQPIT